MILVISGTNRPDANSLKIARLADETLGAQGAAHQLMNLADLPVVLYAPTTYAQKPESFEPFQKAVHEAAGIVIVTPEYNGSFPGMLKYFIDMLKFPETFAGQPIMLIGVAAGQWGALRSVEQLTQILVYRNAMVFPGRLLLPKIHTLLDAQGKLTVPDIEKRLGMTLHQFIHYVEAISGKSQHSHGAHGAH